MLNLSIGVVSMHVNFYALDTHVEFYMSRDNLLLSGAAPIRHCLLRVQSEEEPLLIEFLTTIADVFTQFAYLETVVIETGPGVYDVQILTDSLRKVNRVVVQHRTTDDGHKLALQAKNSPSCSTSAGLLSPFWCLQEDAENWEDW